MSEEETKVTMKIPLFEEGEIEKIDRFTSEIARVINEKVVKEKEMIIAQRLIYNLQQRIDKAIEYINEHKHLSMFADCTEPEEDWIYDLEITANELLDILKGSDTND